MDIIITNKIDNSHKLIIFYHSIAFIKVTHKNECVPNYNDNLAVEYSKEIIHKAFRTNYMPQ